MHSQWLNGRYERYRAQQDKARLREQGKINAITSFDSRFESLKYQVKEDVQTYNAMFSQYAIDGKCRAGLEQTTEGYIVSVGVNSVQVSKRPSSTVIALEFLNTGAIRHDSLEVVADEDGKVKYEHDGKLLDDNQASEVILDPILCGQ